MFLCASARKDEPKFHAKEAAAASQSVDLMPARTNAATTTPIILVSTIPAELIQTEGAPNLVPIVLPRISLCTGLATAALSCVWR